MSLFFEQSFEQFRAKTGLAGPQADRHAALRAWRLEAQARWLEIRSGEHFHDGVPCAHVTRCHRYVAPAAAGSEAAE